MAQRPQGCVQMKLCTPSYVIFIVSCSFPILWYDKHPSLHRRRLSCARRYLESGKYYTSATFGLFVLRIVLAVGCCIIQHKCILRQPSFVPKRRMYVDNNDQSHDRRTRGSMHVLWPPTANSLRNGRRPYPMTSEKYCHAYRRHTIIYWMSDPFCNCSVCSPNGEINSFLTMVKVWHLLGGHQLISILGNTGHSSAKPMLRSQCLSCCSSQILN